ncbi:MAG: bifunctional 4-hydroxy-3-methylbut-2-enyl diphosphate reductase/30S ribosomal protein S1 [Peptococcaceae bacterium]|nr:bifunctional 4-hydroxy-3-methylbut-2-enyl diphosphate reductase/30S ribosomal protein S1 [Peptococcaceae bacterium]
MEVLMAKTAGFCFGVNRALNIASDTVLENNGRVYTLGPLIHNQQVQAKLAEKGIEEITSLTDIEQGTLIIRSHGVGPSILEQAIDSGLNVIDATCPFVSKIHVYADELVKEGFYVVVVGDGAHPEVRGIIGWTGGEAVVVEDAAQAGELSLATGKVGVIAQTTQEQKNFASVVQTLKEAGKEIKVYNTICNATAERQQSALELAGQVEVMVVVGGFNSSNTRKLVDICRNIGKTTYHVETADDLNPVWFRGIKKTGLTAGASTPDWIIEEVRGRMSDIDELAGNEGISEEEVVITEEEKEEAAVEVSENTTEEQGVESSEEFSEETTEDQAQESSEETTENLSVEEPSGEETVAAVAEEEEEEDAAGAEEGMEDTVEVKSLRQGEIVKGVVVHISQDEVMVDVGAKSEGIIPLRELSCCDVSSPQDIVKIGDEIEVCIIKAEDNEGKLILSKEKADAEKAWDSLDEALNSENTVKGIVREVVKGGLLVDVGARAFLPASLVERGYVEDLSVYLGQEINARVIEINRGRKKIILSRKAVLEEEYARTRQDMLDNLQEGQVVNGTVRRLTQFGAFVDIGGVDGLLHISEMSWYRISHPSEVVKVGDEIDIKVLKVDRDSEKISLGLKQVLPNPWDTVDEKYPVGDIITAKVVRLAPFGAFVQLEPGVEGLVHISHLADRHVAKPDEVVTEGENVSVKVLSVDKNEKRVRLSIREVAKEQVQPEEPETVEYQQMESPEPEASEESFTIGDRLGDLGNLFDKDNN